MVHGGQGACHPSGRIKFTPMALAIIDAQQMKLIPVTAGHCRGHG
jgi:hypothetical protein